MRYFIYMLLLGWAGTLMGQPAGAYAVLADLDLLPSATVSPPAVASSSAIDFNFLGAGWLEGPAPRSVFPRSAVVLNPSPGSDAVQLFFPDHGDRQIRVCNLAGEQMESALTTTDCHFIPTADWPRGEYYLTVRQEARRSVYRLSIE